ncbi:dynamin family protein [bacterium]|nr:dynamin family protein [bacterium]
MDRRAVELNDNHRRVLMSGLTHLDDRLAAVATIASAATAGAPFSPYVADLAPAEVHLLHDYLGEIRSRMSAMVADLGLAPAHGVIPTSRAVEVTLLGAEIELGEIGVETLRGYGPLPAESAALVEQTRTNLCRLLQRLREVVARRTAEDLGQRIAHLDQGVVDARALSALERLIRRRGLVTLREPLEALVERVERQCFEICVFGRVNAGKSSLLNTVLETTALPVGVTPVTAVPTRVVRGSADDATIELRDGQRVRVPLTRLREFVSEEENPENRKGVAAACVRVRSARLRDGVAFVDTPGIGSLATEGARAAYRYLPRADLGIVLIDAAGPPTRDDVQLLHLLEASGIAACVVLTKIDLLSESERARALRYAQERLAGALGHPIAVHAVSTHGAAAALADQWFREVIVPRSVDGRARAAASSRQRFATLVGAVRALTAGDANGAGRAPAALDELEVAAARAERALAEARKRCDDGIHELRGSVPQAFAAAARVAADHIRADGDWSVAGPAATAALETAADATGDEIEGTLTRLTEELGQCLRRAGTLAGMAPAPDAFALDFLSRPALRLPAAIHDVTVKPSFWAGASRRALERYLVRRLRAQVERPATDALAHLAAELHGWTARTLESLRRQIAAHLDPLRSLQGRRVGPAGQPGWEPLDDPDRRDLALIERCAADLAPDDGADVDDTRAPGRATEIA